MKNYLIKLIITALLIVVISYFLKVEVTNYTSIGLLTIVLSLLNTFVKPILKIFTFPITILTLGVSLLLINALMLFVADFFVEGFKISSILVTFVFSIILAVSQFILNKIFTD